jgi:predicted site-specific integrase-resolvase
MDIYTPKKFAKKTRVTVQRWDREGRLTAKRTHTNRRYYSESLSPEREMEEDLMTIVDCFSSRLYGLRSYRKSLKKVLEDDESTQNPPQPNA